MRLINGVAVISAWFCFYSLLLFDTGIFKSINLSQLVKLYAKRRKNRFTIGYSSTGQLKKSIWFNFWIQSIAESKNLHGVNSESASKISDSVNMAVQLVVRNALRFQRAGRRKHLVVEDIDAAIKLVGLTVGLFFEFLFNFEFSLRLAMILLQIGTTGLLELLSTNLKCVKIAKLNYSHCSMLLFQNCLLHPCSGVCFSNLTYL